MDALNRSWGTTIDAKIPFCRPVLWRGSARGDLAMGRTRVRSKTSSFATAGMGPRAGVRECQALGAQDWGRHHPRQPPAAGPLGGVYLPTIRIGCTGIGTPWRWGREPTLLSRMPDRSAGRKRGLALLCPMAKAPICTDLAIRRRWLKGGVGIAAGGVITTRAGQAAG